MAGNAIDLFSNQSCAELIETNHQAKKCSSAEENMAELPFPVAGQPAVMHGDEALLGSWTNDTLREIDINLRHVIGRYHEMAKRRPEI